MKETAGEETEFQIPLADLLNAVKRGKNMIFLGAAACSLLLCGYQLTKPVAYKADATFKEKSNSQANVASSSVATMLLNGISAGKESEARTIMLSRKLLEHVVKAQGLQAVIKEKKMSWPLLKTAYENMVVAYAYFRGTAKHPLPDVSKPLALKNIKFPGELAYAVTLKFDDENSFEVIDGDDTHLGTGNLGTPFTTRDFSFTLAKGSDEALAKKTFVLTLLPLYDVTSSLAKQIKIEADKDDSSLLNVSYLNRDRYLARDVVNQLMYSYQNYLKTEQQRLSSEQITYLNLREAEMGKNLEEMITSYAEKMSSDVSTLGFADSKKAMEFLAAQLQLFRGKTLKIDLELSRLSRVQNENTDILIDAEFQGDSSPYFINKVVDEITALRLQEDGLILALRDHTKKGGDNWQISFQELIEEIEDLRNCHGDACTILAALEGGHTSLKKVPLIHHPKYRLNVWYEQMEAINRDAVRASADERDNILKKHEQFKTQFISYLENLIHYLEVSEKAAEERISHQQGRTIDFQGITLNAAGELYINYSKELSELEAQTLQLNFLLKELEDPNFEISSLSSIIVDPVTRGLVEEASIAVIALKDDHNRSDKEKQRLKDELAIKRRFLTIHLEQTVSLLNLRQNLIKDKINALQSATLELVHQQLSILEKHLYDSIKTHIGNLQEEKNLIAMYQGNLTQEMATLPRKWAAEKLIEHKLEMNTKMVEELTRLVETKIISANLERIQSAPIDLAIAPIRPIKPKMFLYSVFGALMGAFLASGFVLGRAIISGLPASKEGIELCDLRALGTLRKDLSCSGDALRRLEATVRRMKKEKGSLSLVFIGEGGKKVFREFVKMLEERKETVHFFDITDVEEVNQSSLKDLEEQHDWIIAHSSASLQSPEAEQLIMDFDYCAIIVCGETLNQLSHLIKTIKKEGKDAVTSFLIKEDN